MKLIIKIVLTVLITLSSFSAKAWEGMAMPELKVSGNQLVDSHGNVVKIGRAHV